MCYVGHSETVTWRLRKIKEYHLGFGKGEGDKKIGNKWKTIMPVTGH